MNTMQQEFNIIVAHLYKQGKPAKKENDDCAYRGLNGTSCAVGCRIPDEAYVPEMDSTYDQSFEGIMTLFSERLPKEFEEYPNLYALLQAVHDKTATDEDDKFDLDSLNVRLGDAAEELGLTFTVPA